MTLKQDARRIQKGDRRDLRRHRGRANYADAAAAAGVSSSVVSAWRVEGEAVAKMVQESEGPLELTPAQWRVLNFWKRFTYAESQGAIDCATVVYNAAMKDPQYALHWLTRRRPADWGITQRTELTGANGGPVESVTRVIFEETEQWRGGSVDDNDLPGADPAPGQKIVHSHPARFKWLCCGRRWRKTTLAMRVAYAPPLPACRSCGARRPIASAASGGMRCTTPRRHRRVPQRRNGSDRAAGQRLSDVRLAGQSR
jgi:hypothetical protein